MSATNALKTQITLTLNTSCRVSLKIGIWAVLLSDFFLLPQGNDNPTLKGISAAQSPRNLNSWMWRTRCCQEPYVGAGTPRPQTP